MSKEHPIVLSSPERSLGGSSDEHTNASNEDNYNPDHNASDANDEEAIYDDSNEDNVPNMEGTADTFRIDHTCGEH